MSAERVFQLLVAAGLIAGALLYGNYWKQSAEKQTNSSQVAELRAENTELVTELDATRDELAQVRSLLKKGAFPIPDDLIAFVEKDLGLVFIKAPRARLAAPNALRNTAERNLELVYGKDGLAHDQGAWELIGLIPPNQSLRGQWIIIETVGAKGLFDLSTGEILLAESFDPISIPDSAILVHLLARQLLFQNHPQTEWSNLDAWRAWQATYRGAAAGVQARYMRRRAATEEIEWKDSDQERESILLQLPPVMQGLANFPYVDGNEYAQHFYLKSREALREMFRNPPLTTDAVIHPTDDRASTASPPLPELGKEGIIWSNKLGALGLRLLLDPYLGNEDSDLLAKGWREDVYHLGETSLVWKITMSTPEQAQSLSQALLKIEVQDTTRKTEAQGNQVTLTVDLNNDR